MRSRQMWSVDVRRHARDIDRGATETAGPAFRKLRRQAEMGVVHGIFPRRPGLLASIFFKINFSAFRQILSPHGFELGTRLIERLRSAIEVLAMVGRRVEAALPAPLVDVNGNSSTFRDRPDANDAVIDVPAVWAIG